MKKDWKRRLIHSHLWWTARSGSACMAGLGVLQFDRMT